MMDQTHGPAPIPLPNFRIKDGKPVKVSKLDASAKIRQRKSKKAKPVRVIKRKV